MVQTCGSMCSSRPAWRISSLKEELWENLLMSPMPYSFKKQEDTRDIPREGRYQVGHLLASMPSPPIVSHRSNVLITHPLELTVNLPVFAPGGSSCLSWDFSSNCSRHCKLSSAR